MAGHGDDIRAVGRKRKGGGSSLISKSRKNKKKTVKLIHTCCILKPGHKEPSVTILHQIDTATRINNSYVENRARALAEALEQKMAIGLPLRNRAVKSPENPKITSQSAEEGQTGPSNPL